MFSDIVISLLGLTENAFYSVLGIIDATVADNVDMMPVLIGMILLAVFLNIGFWRTVMILIVGYYIFLKYYS